jgi:hypothetical protein
MQEGRGGLGGGARREGGIGIRTRPCGHIWICVHLGAYVCFRVSHERLEPIIEWWAVGGDDKTRQDRYLHSVRYI